MDPVRTKPKNIIGEIRVNANRNYTQCFMTDTDGGPDIFIEGIENRNCALAGDIVEVELFDQSHWKKLPETNSLVGIRPSANVCIQKTGKVVKIVKEKHTRLAYGFLKFRDQYSGGYIVFQPVDNRVPRMRINLKEIPREVQKNKDKLKTTLFLAKIKGWKPGNEQAIGTFVKMLGEAGEIDPETEGHLLCNGIKLVQEEITFESSQTASSGERRIDMRGRCTFTIDPATSRVLDDALSCEKLDDDNYLVGVHIADVSYFVEQNTPIDAYARERARSVYLVNDTIPMLPDSFCERMCSLSPGCDRYAYSVMWKIGGDGTVHSEWFGRTIIRSCAKLSYDQAQCIIQSKHCKDLEAKTFPRIDGQHSLRDVYGSIRALFRLSEHLLSNRVESGALRLDKPKLAFELNEYGLPVECFPYEKQQSNQMVEEFMILANVAVGTKIFESHPKGAILKTHAPPNQARMANVAALCRKKGRSFDISNSRSISQSLQDVAENKCVYEALVHFCAKTFQMSQYVWVDQATQATSTFHYALNIPLYTHFTSPMRRYPDVVTHRLLTDVLEGRCTVSNDYNQLDNILEQCNDKTKRAKACEEHSKDIHLLTYVKNLEDGLNEEGVVVGILDKSVDIMCLRLGYQGRVYIEKMTLAKPAEYDDKEPSMTLFWPRMDRENLVPQRLTIFDSVDVCLKVAGDNPRKILMELMPPFPTAYE